MLVLRVRNVHEALPRALRVLRDVGIVQPSRAGNVIRSRSPVSTIYERPAERVELHAWRDSNPFFHLYESLWMLAGRNDIRPLTRYVRRMAEFSDDGRTQNAAYGYRWRNADKSTDQLKIICEALRADPNSRQQVLQIWDHRLDLGTTTRDHACNVAATFQILERALDMVVFCRSNDVIWGAYGSNAVHFSMLHEYVARRVGVEIGRYTQISVNWHAYVDVYQRMIDQAVAWTEENPYVDGRFLDPKTPVAPYPLIRPGTDFDKWDDDCRRFVTDTGMLPSGASYARTSMSAFFRDVAWPMVCAHDYHRNGDNASALDVIEDCQATDWRRACRSWLLRRQARKNMEQK